MNPDGETEQTRRGGDESVDRTPRDLRPQVDVRLDVVLVHQRPSSIADHDVLHGKAQPSAFGVVEHAALAAERRDEVFHPNHLPTQPRSVLWTGEWPIRPGGDGGRGRRGHPFVRIGQACNRVAKCLPVGQRYRPGIGRFGGHRSHILAIDHPLRRAADRVLTQVRKPTPAIGPPRIEQRDGMARQRRGHLVNEAIHHRIRWRIRDRDHSSQLVVAKHLDEVVRNDLMICGVGQVDAQDRTKPGRAAD
jgi:hypothetical protein